MCTIGGRRGFCGSDGCMFACWLAASQLGAPDRTHDVPISCWIGPGQIDFRQMLTNALRHRSENNEDSQSMNEFNILILNECTSLGSSVPRKTWSFTIPKYPNLSPQAHVAIAHRQSSNSSDDWCEQNLAHQVDFDRHGFQFFSPSTAKRSAASTSSVYGLMTLRFTRSSSWARTLVKTRLVVSSDLLAFSS
jgi:hypothetical protein